MRKTLRTLCCVLMILMLCASLAGCALVAPDGSDTVSGVALEVGSRLAVQVVCYALTILAAFVSAKLSRYVGLKSINAATAALIDAARETVSDLNQTTVAAMRASNGKLDPTQIDILRHDLLTQTRDKLADPIKAVLIAAGVDIDAKIASAGEAWLDRIKGGY